MSSQPYQLLNTPPPLTKHGAVPIFLFRLVGYFHYESKRKPPIRYEGGT